MEHHKKNRFGVGNSWPWHRLPGPSGPEPRKSPKRVPKSVPGHPVPGCPKVPQECALESEKSPELRFRLFSDSGAHSFGALRPPEPEAPGLSFGLFQGSGPERAGRALCQAKGFPSIGDNLPLFPQSLNPLAVFEQNSFF